MLHLTANRIILAKIESTYGADAAPTGSDALRVQNLSHASFEADTVNRAHVVPWFGEQSKSHTKTHRKVSFEMQAYGSGDPGTAPVWGALLRACGFSESVTPDVSVTYLPMSGDNESLTLYYRQDGRLTKITGARGKVTLSLASQALPVLKFEFTGLWSPVTQAALVTPAFPTAIDPQALTKLLTPTFTLHGHALAMKSLEVDFGIEVSYRNLVGYEGVNKTGAAVSANTQCLLPELSTLDAETLAVNATRDALQLVHGTVAGNILEIQGTQVQVMSPKEADDNGVRMLQCQLLFHPTSGNDEIRIISR
ncbi:hypothetical protein SIID45300_02391 [Candidatus Magnetaquicoccaceae bacterium FCR-1]|uniref:Phage tail protein n=1 Tax=Candidatus Magnetaquiglobus chichijimensis TaxID=3141448 RepID=A0ABQ0CAY1_9PROT